MECKPGLCHLNDVNNICFHNIPIFSHLNDKEIVEITRLTDSTSYKKGEMIFVAGNPANKLFIINQGKVKISKVSKSGREQIIRVTQTGDFIGEISLFGNVQFMENAEVLESTVVCYIHKKEMERLLYKYPNIALKILKEFSNRLQHSENLIELLGLMDAEQRVAKYLLELTNGKKSESIEVTLPISKQDLASYIGTTKETLSRKLSSLQEKGFIQLIGQRRILIVSVTDLEKMVHLK